MTGPAARALWLAGAAGMAALFAVVLGIALLGADLKAAECGDTAGGGPGYAPSGEALADIPGNYLLLYRAGRGRVWARRRGVELAGRGRLDRDRPRPPAARRA